MDVIRYHEISECDHRIMNPTSAAKLSLLGDICGVGPETRVLDLACGKGELLCQLASRHGATGTGIDIHPPFVAAARRRAAELGVEGRVEFREGDAGDPTIVTGRFGVVSCIGATWIGGGLSGTLQLMDNWLASDGWLLVGEPYWAEEPSTSLREVFEVGQDFVDLAGTLGRFEADGLDLVEMLLSNIDDWDRYATSQWLNVARWLDSHRDDPEATEVRAIRDAGRRLYLAEERRCLGWGVFVLRRLDTDPTSGE